MNTEKEKLSLLSDLIAIAKADNEIREAEYELILAVANQLGVDKATLDKLFDTKAERVPLKLESQRILQFHRLVLLMNVDGENHINEMETIHNIGLKMGLNPMAIDQVLKVMYEYPNRVVPPEVLVGIFKAHYN